MCTSQSPITHLNIYIIHICITLSKLPILSQKLWLWVFSSHPHPTPLAWLSPVTCYLKEEPTTVLDLVISTWRDWLTARGNKRVFSGDLKQASEGAFPGSTGSEFQMLGVGAENVNERWPKAVCRVILMLISQLSAVVSWIDVGVSNSQ